MCGLRLLVYEALSYINGTGRINQRFVYIPITEICDPIFKARVCVKVLDLLALLVQKFKY